jgi:hypothetical protein
MKLPSLTTIPKQTASDPEQMAPRAMSLPVIHSRLSEAKGMQRSRADIDLLDDVDRVRRLLVIKNEGRRQWHDTAILSPVERKRMKSIAKEQASSTSVVWALIGHFRTVFCAERCALFLPSPCGKLLVAQLHDGVAFGPTISIPIESGIAGYVFASGEMLNVADPYADPRFNKQVDNKTGFRTKSVCCNVVKWNGKTVGVVELINKRGGKQFTEEDECTMVSCCNKLACSFAELKLHCTEAGITTLEPLVSCSPRTPTPIRFLLLSIMSLTPS